MLDKWIKEESRQPCSYSFSVTDISEIRNINKEIEEYIANCIIDCFRDINYLKHRYKDKPHEKLKEYIKRKIFASNSNNLSKNVRQGDWGEVITAKILEDFRGLFIPIRKLAWKINNEKAMFGTDVFAIREDEKGNIKDLVYCECKTKRTYSKDIGIEAYNSLYKDNGSSLPDIIDFISRAYYEAQEYDMADKFDNIYDDLNNYNSEFQIFLIFDKNIWKEEVLQKLHNLPPNLKNLHINVLLIENLKGIIEDTYNMTVEVGEKIVYEQ